VNDVGEFQYAEPDQSNHQYESELAKCLTAGIVGGLIHGGALSDFRARTPSIAAPPQAALPWIKHGSLPKLH
jgi:hypothetical protein